MFVQFNRLRVEQIFGDCKAHFSVHLEYKSFSLSCLFIIQLIQCILNSLNSLFLTNLILTGHLQTVRKSKPLAKHVNWLQQLTNDLPIPSEIWSGLLLSHSADTPILRLIDHYATLDTVLLYSKIRLEFLYHGKMVELASTPIMHLLLLCSIYYLIIAFN